MHSLGKGLVGTHDHGTAIRTSKALYDAGERGIHREVEAAPMHRRRKSSLRWPCVVIFLSHESAQYVHGVCVCDSQTVDSVVCHHVKLSTRDLAAILLGVFWMLCFFCKLQLFPFQDWGSVPAHTRNNG